MRRIAGLLVAFAATFVPVPAAQADPGVAVLDLTVTVACFGCGTYGPSGNDVSGTVTVGHGTWATGAAVTGDFTVNSPAGATCQVDGSADGTLTIGGQTAAFTWDDGGRSWAVPSFGDGVGVVTVTEPVGNPCGTMATLAMRVTLSHGDVAAGPPFGRLTIGRTADGTVRLLNVPVSYAGAAWTCVDAATQAAVAGGAVLTTPDPAVECTPPSGMAEPCERLAVLVSAAPPPGDEIGALSGCTTFAAGASVPSGVPYDTLTGTATTPWWCEVDETIADPALVSYVVVCDINL